MSNNESLIKYAYFTSLAGLATLFGFSSSLGKLRKDETIKEAVAEKTSTQLHREGAALARRALFRATVYTVGSFGGLLFVSYHLFGRKLLARKAEEFRQARERGVDLTELRFLFPNDELPKPGQSEPKRDS